MLMLVVYKKLAWRSVCCQTQHHLTPLRVHHSWLVDASAIGLTSGPPSFGTWQNILPIGRIAKPQGQARDKREPASGYFWGDRDGRLCCGGTVLRAGDLVESRSFLLFWFVKEEFYNRTGQATWMNESRHFLNLRILNVSSTKQNIPLST